jgi:asparagine synthase (glutamine-hydrolysing)
MCGISGFFSSSPLSKALLERMTSKLSHRGPDAEGYFFDELAGLGHRRLSIIDLSESANQPMVSANGRFVIVFNGEIYNFREIAGSLDVKLRTGSDTEVLIEAFSRWGTGFVHKLKGMFALAIYDIQEKELFLFRDRLGIKPLYYLLDDRGLLFASELKAIRNVAGPLETDPLAVYGYLHLGYIPAPMTVYSSVYKLEPGHYIKMSRDGFKKEAYWEATQQINDKVLSGIDNATVKLNDLLLQSVREHLISDVPVGTLLSGGIDSGLITALAMELSGNISTFSVGFAEESHNEARHAKAVAGFLGTNHHELIVTHKDAMELIPRLTDVFDEPYSDSSAIPVMLVSAFARKHVKVVLSGDGGDELFMGYGAYKWAERLNNPFLKLFRRQIAFVLSQGNDRYKRAAGLFRFGNGRSLKSHIFSQEQYLFSEEELMSLLPGIKDGGLVSFEADVKARKLTAMEEQALFDLRYYLPDDLLTKIDRASMYHSLEARVPYLDHHVVEFALNLSPGLKYRNGIQKYLLKEVLYRYVPSKLFDRPKQGFAIPLGTWLKGELDYLINDYLSEDLIRKHNTVRYEEVDRIKSRFMKGEDHLYNRLWTLIQLHKWMEERISDGAPH